MKKPPPGMKSMPVKPAGTSPVKPPPPKVGGSMGKPKVSRTPIRPGRPPGFGGMKSGGMKSGGMKSGGMVKGKK